jgi:hypothetical protein
MTTTLKTVEARSSKSRRHKTLAAPTSLEAERLITGGIRALFTHWKPLAFQG